MASLVEGTAFIHPQQKRIQVANKIAQIERRSKVRYPIDAPVTFRALNKTQIAGDGKVENMSSVGVFVISDSQVRVGTILELRMGWPTLLEERVPLQLIAVGKVVRSSASSFAVLFRRYEFRTRPQTSPGAVA